MTIVQDHASTVHVEDDDHEHTEDDAQWWSDQNTDWHDDDQADDIDQRAGEFAYIAAHEQGLKTF
jgi:hypothetical protein